jgi:hypothetical protein
VIGSGELAEISPLPCGALRYKRKQQYRPWSKSDRSRGHDYCRIWRARASSSVSVGRRGFARPQGRGSGSLPSAIATPAPTAAPTPRGAHAEAVRQHRDWAPRGARVKDRWRSERRRSADACRSGARDRLRSKALALPAGAVGTSPRSSRRPSSRQRRMRSRGRARRRARPSRAGRAMDPRDSNHDEG